MQVTQLCKHDETGGHCSVMRGKIHLVGCFEEQVIVKKYQPEFCYEATNEIRMAKKNLHHDNLLLYRSFSGPVEGGFYFFVVPFYEIGLNTVLYNNHKIKPLKFAIELLSAIDHLHKNGVVHRDLKPDNIRVHRGSIKLIDFSLCGMQGTSTFKTFEPHNIWYRSPEWFSSSGAQAPYKTFEALTKADLWAAGMVLVEFDLKKPVCAGAENNMIRFFEHKFFTCKQASTFFGATHNNTHNNSHDNFHDNAGGEDNKVYQSLVCKPSLPLPLVNSLLQIEPQFRKIVIRVV